MERNDLSTREDRDIEEALDRREYSRAVTLLAERYRPKLRQLFSQRCGQAADDLVQTIFEQVCRDIVSFQRKGSVRGWLYGIAYHRSIDHQRSRASHASHLAPLADDFEGLPPDSSPWSSVDRLMDEPARLRLLGELLGECEPEVGLAIALYHLEGFTFPEMAEICGDKPTTLQARVARAIPRLQKRIKSMGLESRAI